MDEIATYQDALPSYPDYETGLTYPESSGLLTFKDDYFNNFDDFNKYYIMSDAEHKALDSVDLSNSSVALIQMEYIRTYETIKIKETVTGIFVFIIFCMVCKFFRGWLGGR